MKPTPYNIFCEVEAEIQRATAKHGPFPTRHHGWAVIKEELDEAFDEIKANDNDKLRYEMIQVAAMAMRFIMDLANDTRPN